MRFPRLKGPVLPTRAQGGSHRRKALRRRQRRRTRIGAIGATVCLAALGTAAVPVLLPRLLPDSASQARVPEVVRTPAESTPDADRTSGSGKGSSAQPTIPASGPGTFRTAPLTGTGPASGTPFRVQVEDGAGVDPADAARQIAAILDDQRGWRRAGAGFRQVTGAEAELTFRVATAKTTDKLCNVRQADHIGEVNCRTGADVVINLKRWQLGSPEFDGPPVEYRALIVNHEVGHWLGRGHLTCPGPGRPAPAMMQQIDGLKGCVSNAWPYDTQGRYLNGPAVP
ncbi:DUF3152 domain-containing protein [Streptomyces sp. SID12501]|uniref:DUF3152 domain-containing protein n=1 Tax=Streptomyces sp. SID12501 TaxID=2706042 RepID=A0A6B3C2D9_9ACTN|nr:DUF3152 domain-containing protein [Streptomyces sp. SID12501]NEC90885.1 DUF3152 domain-containing protein [Streptomyces sp. SID12501]